ncbi:hypothetical protein [Pedobacter sp. JY14-1]|uniref:hypothetical protein n=1 Tax=Pedobacter sp. JY14-1 TaxID=3034151 RepID=UPI0023E266B0|nr:hypothetical protein [Pedobacter sp. JY14-1]
MTLSWKQEVLQGFHDLHLPFRVLQGAYSSVSPVSDISTDANAFQKDLLYNIVFFEHAGLAVNLVDIVQAGLTGPEALLGLQQDYALRGIQLLHLWEDVWLCRPAQVLGRIRALLGLNERLHGRKLKVEQVDRKVAGAFMEQHHLMGAAGSKYRLALVQEGIPVAVACFGPLRKMRRGRPGYRSAELVRFASRSGYSVAGGFTRLLKHFIREHHPDDVMTYADRDWSSGAAYRKSGFVLTGVTSPAWAWLDGGMKRHYREQLPLGTEKVNAEPIRVFNTGNLKYILYLDKLC